jgi:hypoxanthine phosphoribosyltransferase
MAKIEQLIWTDIEILVEKIAKDIQQKNIKYNYIMGLPRGGLIPSVMLSHILRVNMCPTITGEPSYSGKILLVDDIADSGGTLKRFSNNIDKAVLCCKMRIESKDRPTYYGAEIADDIWIMFPWEREKDDPISEANYKDYHFEARDDIQYK